MKTTKKQTAPQQFTEHETRLIHEFASIMKRVFGKPITRDELRSTKRKPSRTKSTKDKTNVISNANLKH